MHIASVLDTGMRILFLILGGVTLANYLHHRNRSLLDIHLMFLSVAILMLVQFIAQITGHPLALWNTVALFAFLAQPHLLLRLTSNYRFSVRGTRVLRLVRRSSLAGLLISWILLGSTSQPMPLWRILVILIYFIGVEGIAATWFVRSALNTVGVTRHRLGFVALGSGCLAFVLLMLGIGVITTDFWVREASNDSVPLFAVLCALSYYIGFLPPGFLRHAWEWNQFFHFRQGITGRASRIAKAEMLKTLCDSSIRVTAGSAAALSLTSTGTESLFRVEAIGGSVSLPESLRIRRGIIAEAWLKRRTVLGTNPSAFGLEEAQLAAEFDIRAVMAVPIESFGQLYGVLVVLFYQLPLFPSDAERILRVFADTVGIMLAYDASVVEQKNLVTQLRQSNAELQQATQMKSEFLANMSHELRTPLNAIIGFSELMQDGRLGPISDQYQELLGDILTSARHLLQLINDILDLSKIESGKMEFYAAPVEVAELVTEVRDIVRSLSSAKRLHVHTEVESDLGEVILDPAKFKQVLYNYLSNAIKFTPEEGSIIIRVVGEGAWFRLEVQDTGIGIRPKDMDLLFKEFQQVDGSSSKEYQGTGLGLALTKRIVEAQGGRVGVESILGEGSVFFAVLPRQYTGLGEEQALLPKDLHPKEVPDALRILVVEDEATDVAWLERILSDSGYSVLTAQTGQEALEISRQKMFDAIILDLILPDMSGLQVLQGMRAGTMNENTPVIVVSVVAEKGVVAGFAVQSFLTKPIQRSELLESLMRAGVRPKSRLSVLVVDDDSSSRRLMETNLSQLGYHALSASNGEIGLQMVAQWQVAAVVLDLLMPGVDGFEFLARLRDTPHGHGIPVVVWTAKELTEHDNEMLRKSARAVVLKRHGRVSDLLHEIQMAVMKESES